VAPVRGDGLTRLSRTNRVLLAICALALAGCLLGLVEPPAAEDQTSVYQEALGLTRIVTTSALVLTLLLGPGIAWRSRRPGRTPSLGFLPLPGLAVLSATGCLTWALSGSVTPSALCLIAAVAVVGWLAVGVLRAGPEPLLAREEVRVLLVVACALGIAVGRAVWSLGPEGELLGDTVYRTLEVGDRTDSRIPYAVAQLVANGTAPYSDLARDYFEPYNFSARGPLTGIASAPVVLAAGGRPPVATTPEPWAPFDAQGFMAYRLAMMSFALTALLSLWTLTRRLGGERAARLAVLLGATTPFVVHEAWFTWPKLLAASFVLLAARRLLDRHAVSAGLLIGVGYLVHPLVLLSLPALGLLALWPRARPNWRRPDVRAAAAVAGGTAASFVAWRIVNGSHYVQGDFLDYFARAGRERWLSDRLETALGLQPAAVTVLDWLSARAESVANTLVPLWGLLFSADSVSLNVIDPGCHPFCAGDSPGVVQFFLQYWVALPFGVGILFFALLLVSLWRAVRLWRWPVVLAVVVPFVTFAVYWGDATTGMLREGLQPWILVLLAVVAVQQGRERFPWLRSAPIRALLALRALEVVLLATVPALATRGRLLDPDFRLTDAVAVLTMVVLSVALAMLVWRERPADQPLPAQPERAREARAYAQRA
jgi:hypothetical protein